MIYLLDSSVCVDCLRHPDSVMRVWVRKNLASIRLCSIVQGELLVGIRKKPTKRNRQQVRSFLSEFKSFTFDSKAAESYAVIRAYLEQKGQVISPNDMLIAAVAVSRKATLITGNIKEFKRVPKLQCLSLEALNAP